jgi:hypothetical protein
MKSLSCFVPFTILALTAFSKPITPRDVSEDLIPQFDFQPGLNPTGMFFPSTEHYLNGVLTRLFMH